VLLVRPADEHVVVVGFSHPSLQLDSPTLVGQSSFELN